MTGPMNRPATLAALARRLKAEPGSYAVAMAGFLDGFYSAPERRQAMIDEPPEFLGDPRLDATLGAVGEHLARRWNLAIPAWTEDPARFLKRPYFPTRLERLKPLLVAESPIAFRRRLIFTEAEPLRRARMPVEA